MAFEAPFCHTAPTRTITSFVRELQNIIDSETATKQETLEAYEKRVAVLQQIDDLTAAEEERKEGLGPAAVVWCGVVWCGVVWCGVVWCGVV